MTELAEQTFDGKLLPRHLKMFRDIESGRIELRYWDTEITDVAAQKEGWGFMIGIGEGF